MIEVASAADLDALLRIDVLLTSRQRQDAIVRESVAAGQCFVARAAPAIAGYVTWDRGFFDRPFVRLLVVAGPHRRRGLGAALLGRVERAAAGFGELFVSTEFVNAPMQALLGRLCFEPSGSVDNVNAPGNPELIYYKRLR